MMEAGSSTRGRGKGVGRKAMTNSQRINIAMTSSGSGVLDCRLKSLSHVKLCVTSVLIFVSSAFML